MRLDDLYIKDILEAIQKIEDFTKDLSEKQFLDNVKTVAAVLYEFSVIGEAAKSLSEKMKQDFSKIPWQSIVAMRNMIIHEYFGTDLEIVWNAIQQDLPILKKTLKNQSV